MKKCHGEELITVGTTIAFSLAQNCSPDELNILGALFCVIGDQLALLSATKELASNCEEKL